MFNRFKLYRRTSNRVLLKKEHILAVSKIVKKIGSNRYSHGLSHSKVYSAWSDMKARCFKKNRRDYKNYGARGITVCKEWLRFENFYKDMGLPPTKSHTIDRINNNGNYEPSNCRWVTKKEQSRNRRTNIFLELNGVRLCLADWSIKLGIGYWVMHSRVRRGKSVEEILSKNIK